MVRTIRILMVILSLILLISSLQAASYPDHWTYLAGGDSLLAWVDSLVNVEPSADGKGLQLAPDQLTGYVVFKPQTVPDSFNQGLPSWNGHAQTDQSAFKVYIRFPYNGGWSRWMTAGYWKSHIWSSYGYTSYQKGSIDVDYVQLTAYQAGWQFKVEFKRKSLASDIPSLWKLSLFTSDSRTTDQIDYTQLRNDNPDSVFVPTRFVAQHLVDPEIGGSICSPSTVAMILSSYEIDVDVKSFAENTLDPYWEMFGVWPRVVVHASEYGLNGSVTRYRSWSQAREVLAAGGRIGMSVSTPLYGGHLMMLAGFTSDGRPIVHDPARTDDGYSKIFDKTELAQSWIGHGGIAYTFYPSDPVTPVKEEIRHITGPDPIRIDLYPNPCSDHLNLKLETVQPGTMTIQLYNLNGQLVQTLFDGFLTAGYHPMKWNRSAIQHGNLAAGIYLVVVRDSGRSPHTRKLVWLK
ncbi:MAG: C39 family peptidase [Candidatus Delongbacteria bacterium]|nr:C39 family peptidase [Candidatus Delongbacteria bacterium]